MRKIFLSLIIVVLFYFLVGCGGSSNQPNSNDNANNQSTQPPKKEKPKVVIRIGRIPFRNSRDLVKTHEPLLVYLKNYLKVDEVKILSAPDYKGMGDLLKNKQIDLAWLGTKNYLRLKAKLPIEPLVRPIRYGKPYYRGIIITRVDSGINSLEDLKGKTFAFVDKGSASGYLYPLALLLKQGIIPDRDFKKVLFLGEHDTVVYNVFLKKVDAGSVYDDARLTLKDKNQRKELKVIARTANIPNEPIVVRKDMSQEMKEKIKAAFLALKLDDKDKGAVLRQYNSIIKDNIYGFAPVTDKDYDVVRELQKIVDNYLKKAEEKQGKKEDGEK